MMFIKNNANSHGWVNPRDIEDIWRDHFDYFYREHKDEGFIFPITVHPDVSGRPHVLLMHERLIEHINKHEGVEWVTMAEICDEFKRNNPYPESAMRPSPPGQAALEKSSEKTLS
jgi:peptidoglycan/xylan/chitin deacetylase (PgdA/CDA1 family)